MLSPILFGVDLVALGLGLTKLLVDLFQLKERAANFVRAAFAAVAVLAVGLEKMGLIPILAEPYVVLSANVLAAFLITLGYMPEASTLLTSWSDRVRLNAYIDVTQFAIKVQPEARSANRRIAQRLADRYGVGHLLKGAE